MDFFRKYDQIPRTLRIWSHLLMKSLMENFFYLFSDFFPPQLTERTLLLIENVMI